MAFLTQHVRCFGLGFGLLVLLGFLGLHFWTYKFFLTLIRVHTKSFLLLQHGRFVLQEAFFPKHLLKLRASVRWWPFGTSRLSARSKAKTKAIRFKLNRSIRALYFIFSFTISFRIDLFKILCARVFFFFCMTVSLERCGAVLRLLRAKPLKNMVGFFLGIVRGSKFENLSPVIHVRLRDS